MIKRLLLFTCLIPVLITLCLGSLAAAWLGWGFVRPQPPAMKEKLFEGLTYTREVFNDPRPMVVHVVKVNLAEDGVKVLVTPGDPKAELPLKARTTSHFLAEFDLQVAVNGDGFTPWYDYSILNYYPHHGDPVDVIGHAISGGKDYSMDTDNEPTLYISDRNRLTIGRPMGKAQNAISGNTLLLNKGEVLPAAGGDIQPRTAAGVEKNDKHLILVVVDGRQPGYSEGVTLAELASILKNHGAYHGINLDGGGSSTLVVEGAFGSPKVLNSPVNHRLPGMQRAVGNHLGIFASPRR